MGLTAAAEFLGATVRAAANEHASANALNGAGSAALSG
jgi:hypothetical protein